MKPKIQTHVLETSEGISRLRITERNDHRMVELLCNGRCQDRKATNEEQAWFGKVVPKNPNKPLFMVHEGEVTYLGGGPAKDQRIKLLFEDRAIINGEERTIIKEAEVELRGKSK